MKKIIIGVLSVFLVLNANSQAKDNLKIIAEKLSSYKTYKTKCSYTFSMPFGDALYCETSIVTQKIQTDTLSGFFYNFSMDEGFRNENFGDFYMYFKNAVYSSYKGEVKKTSFEEKPEAFVGSNTRDGYSPAIQHSPQLYYITPYQLAKKMNEIIIDNNFKVIQLPDTVIMEELCLRFIIKKENESKDPWSDNKINVKKNLELCFNKSELYPVYYKNDVKNDIMNSLQIAQFENTEVNLSLPDEYFTEENLLPKNWQTEIIPVLNKNPANLIGEKAPDWKLPILDNNKNLSSKDLKGKYILLEFTATWCKYCIDAAQMMNRLEEQFGDSEKIAMVSIFSSDIDKKEGIKEFSEKFNLESTILYSASDVGEKYQIFAYPQFFIISPEGKVFMHFSGYGSGLEGNITNLLAALIK
jgi:thiol-disulfide isomerase/thioredoxin